ncbi:MAG: hypothetical protein QM761_01875 [Pseudoxanthomonas sp.]
MRELSYIECEQVDGGISLWAKLIALYDAITDGAEGFIDGAKAGYGYEEK